jgi:LCP family protein required for cell wall assembly
MRPLLQLRNSRLLQLLGLLLALAGLAGFWWPREPERIPRTVSEEQLINPRGEQFQASFIVAGRDYDIRTYASPCRYVAGECVRDRIGEFQLGNRTDTILYVNIVGDDITIIALPRDLYLYNWQTRINAMFAYQGAAGQKNAAEEVLGIPVDYYAIIDIGIFERLVDALGGIELNVPYDMYYTDSAAGLVINFKEGPAHLMGEDAAKFVRYRETRRGDIDRIDNVKRVMYAMLNRVKQLNVRTVGLVPELLDAFFEDVDTNVSVGFISRLLPRVGNLRIATLATLPVSEPFHLEGAGSILEYDPHEVEEFLAEVFGGEARTFAVMPEATLLITNRSGTSGLEDWYRSRLLAMGVPAGQVLTRSGSLDPSPTRVLAPADHLADADYFADLLGASKQQVDRLARHEQRNIHVELILGEDASRSAGWREPVLVSGSSLP